MINKFLSYIRTIESYESHKFSYSTVHFLIHRWYWQLFKLKTWALVIFKSRITIVLLWSLTAFVWPYEVMCLSPASKQIFWWMKSCLILISEKKNKNFEVALSLSFKDLVDWVHLVNLWLFTQKLWMMRV